MTISATILEDSICNGKRITTYILTYPRFIHAELLTHRNISRNSSSSRAIKFEKQYKNISENMAHPIHWGKNQPGMQAKEELSLPKQVIAQAIWHLTGKITLWASWLLNKLGVHKQIVNRISEPFSHITVIVTATEWANFFALRYHLDAQPEIEALASCMWSELYLSTPKESNAEDWTTWHLPFITPANRKDLTKEEAIKISVARCARVSYLTHDGQNATKEADYKLYDRLLDRSPIHASPAEHQAWPTVSPTDRSGNFIGWVQYRQTIEGQNITSFMGKNV